MKRFVFLLVLIISNISIYAQIDEDIKIEVSVAEGEKCERCWNYFDELVEHDGNKVCPRCKKVIENGKFF